MNWSKKYNASTCYLALFLTVLCSSCAKEKAAISPVAPLPGILEYIQKEPRFSLLNLALTRSGLDKSLAEGNITVFAPADSAFLQAGWNRETINQLTPDSIRFVMSYHLVLGIVGSENIAGFYKTFPLTLNKDYKPNIAKNYFGLFFNGNRIGHANLKMGDGLIHELDAISFPPTTDLLTTLYSQSELTIFSAMVKKFATLRDYIRQETLTLIVPVDKAFLDSGFTMQTINDPDTMSLIKRCWPFIGSSYMGRLYTTDFIGTGKFFQTDYLIVDYDFINYRYYLSIDGKEIQPAYDELISGTTGITIPPKFIRQNILSQGGIIHTVDQLFRPLK
jgi:uncharacterized surface protein with fasciclin (FAS1) repeats